MKPDEILSHPPLILEQDARRSYFKHGYIVAEGLIGENWLTRLRCVAAEKVQASRALKWC